MSKGSKSRISNKKAFDINHDEINWPSKLGKTITRKDKQTETKYPKNWEKDEQRND